MSCNVEGARLSVQGLSWGPHAARRIIEEISFTVEPGALLAIIGPNGAGKSSLLRCLFRACRPLSGTVLLDDENIWEMKPRAVAARIAAVLQEMPADFDFRVRDVVMMGRTPHRDGMVRWNERDAHEVEHAIEHMKLEGLAERSFASLSGGEKQRVLVARALAQEPRLLILDEPTNHLDIRHQLEILSLLKGLSITVIATLHDIGLTARFADRVIVMNHGRIVADATPSEALSTAAIREVFGVEANLLPGAPDTPHFQFSILPPSS